MKTLTEFNVFALKKYEAAWDEVVKAAKKIEGKVEDSVKAVVTAAEVIAAAPSPEQAIEQAAAEVIEKVEHVATDVATAAQTKLDEMLAKFGEVEKLEGDKLKWAHAAVEILKRKGQRLKRILVMTVGETEKAPPGTVKVGDHHFLAEYFPPSAEEAARAQKGRDSRGDGRSGGRSKEGKGRRGGRGDRERSDIRSDERSDSRTPARSRDAALRAPSQPSSTPGVVVIRPADGSPAREIKVMPASETPQRPRRPRRERKPRAEGASSVQPSDGSKGSAQLTDGSTSTGAGPKAPRAPRPPREPRAPRAPKAPREPRPPQLTVEPTGVSVLTPELRARFEQLSSTGVDIKAGPEGGRLSDGGVSVTSTGLSTAATERSASHQTSGDSTTAQS